MDLINLNSFLKFGYFLNYQNSDIRFDFSRIDKQRYDNVPYNELIKIGADLWQKAIHSQFKPNQKHLVPISGGLDSRAILAGLLRHTEAHNIYTYTFGTPNTLDYDIGNYVAKKIGTNHTNFDLTKHIFYQNELEDIARRVNFQTILFHHPPIWEIDKIYDGFYVWSGFGSGTFTGVVLTKAPSNSQVEGKIKFINNNTYVNSINLTNENQFCEFLKIDFVNNNLITIDEQLHFLNRQLKYIAPHILIKGYKYTTPFLSQEWCDFMLSVPNRYRIDQKLYKDTLLYSYPKEFSYKTKTNFGLPIGASKKAVFAKRVAEKLLRITKLSSDKMINYLDFNEKIRSKKDLQKVIGDNIQDLKKRRLLEWIDIEGIWKRHIKKQADHADALITLASLEIHLKAGKKL